MEVAGFVIGVAGLAGLFSSCLSVFEMIQLGREQSHDLKLLESKLETQKMRFALWGESIYLNEPQRCFLQNEKSDVYAAIGRKLQIIHDLFSKTDILATRYGLESVKQTPQKGLDTSPFRRGIAVRALSQLRRMRLKPANTLTSHGAQDEVAISSSQRRGSSLRWMICDRKSFLMLIAELRDFNDDLEKLTDSIEAVRRRRVLAAEAVRNVDDEELKLIVQASDDLSDAFSVAASKLLEDLERPVAFKTALDYLEELKQYCLYSGRTNLYDQFLNLFQVYQIKSLPTRDVIYRLSELFVDDPYFLNEMNEFMPHGFHIECHAAEVLRQRGAVIASKDVSVQGLRGNAKILLEGRRRVFDGLTETASSNGLTFRTKWHYNDEKEESSPRRPQEFRDMCDKSDSSNADIADILSAGQDQDRDHSGPYEDPPNFDLSETLDQVSLSPSYHTARTAL